MINLIEKKLFLFKKVFYFRLLEYIVVILHAIACILGAHGRAVTLALFLSFFLAEHFYQSNMSIRPNKSSFIVRAAMLLLTVLTTTEEK
ncbi:MAG: hypothetical protein IJM04_13165 [Prevotella sp.]|nr:hypothetical protein [Prevotella sp.]